MILNDLIFPIHGEFGEFGDIDFELLVKDNKLIFELDGVHEGHFHDVIGRLEKIFDEKVLMVVEEDVEYFGSPIIFHEIDISELTEKGGQKTLLNNVTKDGIIELTNDEKNIYDNLDRDDYQDDIETKIGFMKKSEFNKDNFKGHPIK